MTAAEPRVRKDHNGGLTGDTVAKHVRAMAAAQKLIADGKDAEKAAKKAAKDDGVPVKELERALADSRMDPQALVDRENRYISMLKLLRAPVGTQFSFLDDVDDSAALTAEQLNKKWHNEGYQAGISAKNRDTCPHDPNSEAGRAWGEGYAEGQEKNLSGISDGAGNKAEKTKGKRGKTRAAPANDPDPQTEAEPPSQSSDDDEAPPLPPTAARPPEAVTH